MIEYFVSLNPVIKILMGFTVCGLLSLVFIFADNVINPPPKIYNIKLTEEDLIYFEYDYSMVEITVEKIINQAKEQGYKPPSEVG